MATPKVSLGSAMIKNLYASSWRQLATCKSRAYSVPATGRVYSSLPDIDAAKLSITRTSVPKQLLPPEKLIFGHSFTGIAFFGIMRQIKLLISLDARSYALR